MSDNSHKAEIDAARTEIDAADREILKLLEARLNAVRAIGALKGKDTESPLFDPARERAVLENWTHEAEARGLSGYFTGRILKEVLNYSRRSQEDFMSPESKRSTAEQITVGYQGATCSYSHLAIGKLFATRGVSGVERQGYRTFSDAIDALERGEIDFALLPVENTISGSISEGVSTMSKNNSQDKVKCSRFMREYRWGTYVCLVASLFCFLVALAQLENKLNIVELVQERAFTNALIFGCWFYLCDLRYRLCPEVRND